MDDELNRPGNRPRYPPVRECSSPPSNKVSASVEPEESKTDVPSNKEELK